MSVTPEYSSSHNQIPLSAVVENLSFPPVTAQIAPNVTPGTMPFLEKLHARQRETLGYEYRSRTLLESPTPEQVMLNFSDEARGYFTAMPRADQERAVYLADQLPANEIVKSLSVCVPVASHEEGFNLYRALELYTRQTMPADKYEVFLFLNRPRYGKEGMQTDDSTTLSALAAFKHDYPNVLDIREATAVFEEPVNLGAVKKAHFDAHILRCLRAGVTDPIIIMNDADMLNAHDQYLEAYESYFMESPLIDAVIGEFDLDHGAYVKSPFVHVANRLHMIISTLKGNSTRPVTNSNNTAMRGSAYCALGGNTKMQRSSDSYMGRVLSDLRRGTSTILRPQAREITTETSGRRVVAAWQQGYAPNEKWRLNLGAHNADIRQLRDGVSAEDELFNLADVATFDNTMENILTRLIANYESEGDDPLGWHSSLYREAFSLLGLQYHVEETNAGPRLRLSDTTTLREALGIFRQSHLAEKGIIRL